HSILFVVLFLCFDQAMSMAIPGKAKPKLQPTLVWVTTTNSRGQIKTTQTRFTKKFSASRSPLSEPKIGIVGMGHITGNIGEVRNYATVTVRSGANWLGDVN
ncbi:hypothetical protein BABINDRAFT_16053, partial [Babjeviella inositovora NRRL Y-12698]